MPRGTDFRSFINIQRRVIKNTQLIRIKSYLRMAIKRQTTLM